MSEIIGASSLADQDHPPQTKSKIVSIPILSHAHEGVAMAARNSASFDGTSHQTSHRENESVRLDFISEPLSHRSEFDGIIGRSPTLRRVLDLVNTVATGVSTVLLLG